MPIQINRFDSERVPILYCSSVQRCTWIIVIKQDGSGQELPNRVSRDACKRPQEVILQEELSANWVKRKEVVEAARVGL